MVEKLTRCHGAAQHRQASGTSVYSLAARYAFFRIPRSAATSDLVKFARVGTAFHPRATSRSSRRVASRRPLERPSVAGAPCSTFRAFFVAPNAPNVRILAVAE
ncbi:hypothetical protein EAG_12334 [Camponotus floridanus]|uniref:Uncharacterized protein n=1 Tax=Camponotus floridanus TaxID=104421 RepID=E2B0D9_CAMFO|nr:hypothetical protein EAG_12334 [Camponotus floridanus]